MKMSNPEIQNGAQVNQANQSFGQHQHPALGMQLSLGTMGGGAMNGLVNGIMDGNDAAQQQPQLNQQQQQQILLQQLQQQYQPQQMQLQLQQGQQQNGGNLSGFPGQMFNMGQ